MSWTFLSATNKCNYFFHLCVIKPGHQDVFDRLLIGTSCDLKIVVDHVVILFTLLLTVNPNPLSFGELNSGKPKLLEIVTFIAFN